MSTAISLSTQVLSPPKAAGAVAGFIAETVSGVFSSGTAKPLMGAGQVGSGQAVAVDGSCPPAVHNADAGLIGEAVLAESATTQPLAVDLAEIRAVLAGHPQAFGAIVARYQDMIARSMWRFTRDRNLHEELVQTVFIEAWRQLRNYRGDAPLEHWLQVIATRAGFRFWKGQAKLRQQRESLEASYGVASRPTVTTDPADQAAEAAERVHRTLGQLPPRDRLVITLLHLEEKSVAEVAALTGWSAAMVKVQAFRARKKLAAILAVRGGAES